ncbi:MAG: 1-aminocyclopropane-1-carboxylate deaminase/D-cysteine desulfhydrase [Flavobacteriaceae bacterium]|nr:1-aminocyclopropane-1-carboxylate deaminase/D-cysteine desulfhydrase [Flavobacteriaceae bacterium]
MFKNLKFKKILLPNIKNSIIQKVQFSEIEKFGVSLSIKREDLIHPDISGNKYRKLKYNLLQAQKENKKTLLTFGGAYSNHIAAVASAGKLENFKTIGVVRGDELGDDLEKTLNYNPTLKYASECGMQFKFVSRSDYRKKSSREFIADLETEFEDFYLVPEGGTNEFAVKGCEEILSEKTNQFDTICVAVGTGGTISGLINSAKTHQKIIGFPALKGSFLENEIKEYTTRKNWLLTSEYHFGGYGKTSDELIIFINKFKRETNIQLDPVYTGKMVFGIVDLIKKKAFRKGTEILAIHTGGLQGIEGMNTVLLKKNRLILE